MQDLTNISKAYFIGIGGIGMSALARYCAHLGMEVGGYDRVRSEITTALEQEGIDVCYEDRKDLLWEEAELIVYTPAIPRDHVQLNWYRERNYDVKKRSEVLEAITREKYCIAVAGSHGKTTVSIMITHLLKASGVDCTAFLGGISTNYDSNFVAGESNIVVVEADEYDRSFLRLHPNVAVITAIDPDHLDVYGSNEVLVEAFAKFAKQTDAQGKVILRPSNPLTPTIGKDQRITYDLTDNADVQAQNVQIANGQFHFDVSAWGATYEGFVLNYPGYYNVENTLAALAAVWQQEVPVSKLKSAVASFKGIKRRFEYHINTDRLVYIDDYAHHPVEINALLTSVRDMYPERRITTVFQPHLYSRTRDFADGFATVLDQADQVILLPIYPAREQPIEGVTSEMVLEKMFNNNKRLVAKSDLVDTLLKLRPEVLLTVGAGDIDREVKPIKEALQKEMA